MSVELLPNGQDGLIDGKCRTRTIIRLYNLFLPNPFKRLMNEINYFPVFILLAR